MAIQPNLWTTTSKIFLKTLTLLLILVKTTIQTRTQITTKTLLFFVRHYCLPLILRISKKLQHTLRNKCNMKTVFRTPFKLNKIIKTGKDPLKRCNNKNLAYIGFRTIFAINFVDQNFVVTS